MAKLNKLYYYTRNGEKRINCYAVHISKDIINKANIKDNDEIKIEVKDNKIIIEKTQYEE